MGKTCSPKKTGLLGGSFDPVHTGHLLIARDAMESLELEEVFFIPAAQAPLKDKSPTAAADHRNAMLEAAIQDAPAFQVLDCELNTGGVNYTVDTARSLIRKHPDRRFFWILGDDQLANLHKWKDIAALCQLLEFVALERPGHPLPEKPNIPGLCCHRIRGHLFSISSSEVRKRLANNRPIQEFLPAKVARYIAHYRLYNN